MICSKVGHEVWLLLVTSTFLVWAFTVGARRSQAWLRERRPRRVGLQFIPEALLRDDHVWWFRAFAALPLVIWAGAIMAVVCFFRGPG